MANRGRLYQRLFERDFGYRRNVVFGYLPRRFKAQFQLNPPFSGLHVGNGIYPTDPGDAQYDNFLVRYDVQMPPTATPGLAIRLEWRLTHDALFVLAREVWELSGTDILYIDGVQPVNEASNLSTFGQVQYIPPFTRPPTGHGRTWFALPWAEE